MKRNILLNPGPATTTDTVKQAQIVPDICLQEQEFVEIMKQIRTDLVKNRTLRFRGIYICIILRFGNDFHGCMFKFAVAGGKENTGGQ